MRTECDYTDTECDYTEYSELVRDGGGVTLAGQDMMAGPGLVLASTLALLPPSLGYCTWAGANPYWTGAPTVEQVMVASCMFYEVVMWSGGGGCKVSFYRHFLL